MLLAGCWTSANANEIRRTSLLMMMHNDALIRRGVLGRRRYRLRNDRGTLELLVTLRTANAHNVEIGL